MHKFAGLLDRNARGDPPVTTAELRRQIEDLKIAVQVRDDLIAVAAHELRNPMTPILGVAELALASARAAGAAVPPRTIMLLERMEVLVQDYVRRATRLLDVTRVSSGDFRLEPADIDLSEVVRTVTSRYEVVAAHCRSPFEIEVADRVNSFCDALAAEQVVENLVSNALKFGAGRPVSVRLHAEGGMALVAVRDNGVGMRPDQQARLFGRFEQVLSEYRAGGFGIGLWVSKRLVDAMAGSIEVTSTIGQGSTFVVRLPLAGPAAPSVRLS